MSQNGWIGVDPDGTLAEYDGWKGPEHIGKPVEKMAARVREWLAQNKDVRVFTARISSAGGCKKTLSEVIRFVDAFRRWSVEHFGCELPLACEKDYAMVELWDDRAVQVVQNTGITQQEIIDKLRENLHDVEEERDLYYRELCRMKGVAA